MILHTETTKLMYNWSFLFVVLHKPTLLPSTFNEQVTQIFTIHVSEFKFTIWIINEPFLSVWKGRAIKICLKIVKCEKGVFSKQDPVWWIMSEEEIILNNMAVWTGSVL